MKILQELNTILEKLSAALHELLPAPHRPQIGLFIEESAIALDDEIQSVQRLYNIIWIIQRNIIAVSKSSKDLRKNWFLQTEKIARQWLSLSLRHIEQHLGRQPRSLIPENELSQHISTQAIQVIYNGLQTWVDLAFSAEKNSKSDDEKSLHLLKQSQTLVDQIKLPLLNYLGHFFKDEKCNIVIGELIAHEQLNKNFVRQLFQRIYNFVCLFCSNILPSAREKCHSKGDFEKWLVTPMLQTAKDQLFPFVEEIMDFFMHQCYEMLPVSARSNPMGKPLQIDAIPAETQARFAATFYQVAYQLKVEFIPLIKNADFTSKLSIAKLGLSVAGELKPLLKNLKPILCELESIFVDGLYAKLSEEHRPKVMGEFIVEEQFHKTDGHIWFMQKCYNAACFLFKQFLPELQDCVFSAGIMTSIAGHFPNFVKYFSFVNDIIHSPQKDSFLQTFLEWFQGPLAVLKTIGQTMVPPFAPILDCSVEIAQLSRTVFDQLDRPVVKGNLSYYAMCHVYQAATEVSQVANKVLCNSKEGSEEYKAAEFIQKQFISVDKLSAIGFGVSDNKVNKAILEGIEDFKKAISMPNEWLDTINALLPLIKQDAKPPFIPAVIHEITQKKDAIYNAIESLETDINSFEQVEKIDITRYEEQTNKKSGFTPAPHNLESAENALNKIAKSCSHIDKMFREFLEKLIAVPNIELIQFSPSALDEKSFFRSGTNFHQWYEKNFSKFSEKRQKNAALIEEQSSIILQLKENSAYVKKIHGAWNALITPIHQAIFDFKKPRADYDLECHKKMYDFYHQLDEKNLPIVLNPALPHPIMKERFQIQIERANKQYQSSVQEIRLKLDELLKKENERFQKKMVDQFVILIPSVTQKIDLQCQQLADCFSKVILENQETVSHYEAAVQAAEAYLFSIEESALIESTLKTSGLSKTDPCILRSVPDCKQSDVYQKISKTIDEQRLLLTHLLTTQRFQLEAANKQGVEKARQLCNALKEKVSLYDATLAKIATIHQQMETVSSLEKQKNEALSAQKLSYSVLNILKTQIESADSKLKYAAIKSLLETKKSSYENRLSTKIYEMLLAFIQENLTGQKNNSKEYVMALLEHKIFEIKTNGSLEISEIDKKMNGLGFPKDIALLQQQRQSHYQALYNDLPDKNKPEKVEDELFYQNYNASLKVDSVLQEARLMLSERKASIFEIKTDLQAYIKKLHELSLQIEVLGGEHVDTLSEYIKRNDDYQSKQFLEKTKKLQDLQRDNQTLVVKVNSLMDGHKPLLIKNPTIMAMHESITKDLSAIKELQSQFQIAYQHKTGVLNNARLQFLNRQANKNKLQIVFEEMDCLMVLLDEKIVEVETRKYDEVVDQLFGRALKNPSYILQEDRFYQAIEQYIQEVSLQLKDFEARKIQSDALSPLEHCFNQEMDKRVADTAIRIQKLQTGFENQQAAWQTLSENNPIIKHSRSLLSASYRVQDTVTSCEGYCLYGIHLQNKNFQGVSLKDAQLTHAVLTNCHLPNALMGVDLRGADLATSSFNDQTNFKGVILDEHTKLDWKTCGKQILLDNLLDLDDMRSTADMSALIDLVSQKCPEMSGEWILEMLSAIHRIEKPIDKTGKEHLIAQQTRATFIVETMVSKLDTLDKVLAGIPLIANKHKGDQNPYGFIREELDMFRFKYGNTECWRKIVTPFQQRINQLTPNALTKPQYKTGKQIMETHVEHDYGFGFLYTPSVACKWKSKFSASQNIVIPRLDRGTS